MGSNPPSGELPWGSEGHGEGDGDEDPQQVSLGSALYQQQAALQQQQYGDASAFGGAPQPFWPGMIQSASAATEQNSASLGMGANAPMAAAAAAAAAISNPAAATGYGTQPQPMGHMAPIGLPYGAIGGGLDTANPYAGLPSEASAIDPSLSMQLQQQQQQNYALQQVLQSQLLAGPSAFYPPQALASTALPSSPVSPPLSLSLAHDPSTKTRRYKKDKSKPKRPLSAYNIFFKDERAKMMAELSDKEGDETETSAASTEPISASSSAQDLKEDCSSSSAAGKGGGADSSKQKPVVASSRKRRKKAHGKIGFETMAKTIGARWKQIDPQRLEHYKAQAAVEMKRYRAEMEEWQQKQREGLAESREQLEATVPESTRQEYFATAGGATGKSTKGKADKQDDR